MAFTLLKVKNIFNTKREERLAGSGSQEPEIGFKAVINKATGILYVTIIGARHLPSLFGLSSAKGYVVKVKLFPGDEKFETTLQDTSWPVWNEEFKFLSNPSKKNKKHHNNSGDPLSQLAGKFISLTIYAVLETAVPARESKKSKKPEKPSSSTGTAAASEAASESKLSKFEKILSSSFSNKNDDVTGTKNAGEKRRTVGAATWTFDVKMFQNNLKNDMIGTPDIWRPIEQIGSGLAPTAAAQENKKGQVEVTLKYATSEDGCNDTIEVNVNKMRCTVSTMQEHELQKEPLYIKASISDGETEKHWKSDRFFPTISARWDAKTSCARLRFDSKKLNNVSIYFSLGCKNSMAIKENLGKVVISEKSKHVDLWKKLISSPGVPMTQWLPFE